VPVRALGFLFALLLCAPALAADEQSYEFLNRQAGLQAEYGRLGEAVDSMRAACATAEGGADATCWRRLASIAEQDGRIGLSVDAWNHAAELGDGQARGEGQRLSATYGRVGFAVPDSRGLPTPPVALEYEGLLIDPSVKAYLARMQERISREGLDREELWLPAGSYKLGGVAWTVAPGQEATVELPASLVPYRHRAFGLGGRLPAGVAGPFEFGGDLRVSFGGAPGGGLGFSPIAVGGQIRFGAHVGPVRLEVRGRAEGWPVKSTSAPEGERDATGLVLLAQADVGLDLMLSPRAYLTPHAGVVGGSLGTVIVGCTAERASGPAVLEGECRLGATGVGAQGGVDAWFVPPSPGGRLAIRLGAVIEAGAGGVNSAPDAAIEGGDGLTVLRLDGPQFAWLRGGVDVGVSLRF
jgi:hypothetical protein